MISIQFVGYSDSDEYIDNIKDNVQDLFFQHYPDSECESIIDKEEETFELIFNGKWSNPEEFDEDIIRDICHSNELYCHISIDNEINKSYYYDEDDEFVYR